MRGATLVEARRRQECIMLTGPHSLRWLLAVLLFWPLTARATDEIQVYNAAIAAVGQWTIQQHLNYAFDGRKQPDFPGGLVPNHTLNGTPEFAYGLAPWFEFGFYVPWAIDKDGYHSDGAKLRTLFV